MMKKTFFIPAFLILSSFQLHAQIVTSWDDSSGVVTSMNEGTVEEDDYAAEGIFMDWSDVLSDYNNYREDKGLDVLADRENAVQVEIRSKNGKKVKMPSSVNEKGIDLYLLSREGIRAYLSLDSPAYLEEPDDATIKWIRFYAIEKRGMTARMFARYRKWEPLIKKYFSVIGIPPEMAELCLVESSCTYKAVSKAGAVGMWQIMPATGREYGLAVNPKRDDRLDPVLATEAAAKILKYNHSKTGSWTLAAAAYNCGAGRIQSVVRRGFETWDSMKEHLPQETRQYIPGLIAIHYVWTYRERLGFE